MWLATLLVVGCSMVLHSEVVVCDMNGSFIGVAVLEGGASIHVLVQSIMWSWTH